MVIRKLIDFLSPQKQHAAPLPEAEIAPDAEFDWPPSAADLEKFSVVQLRADDAPGRTTAPLG
jgi:hypothetical protein